MKPQSHFICPCLLFFHIHLQKRLQSLEKIKAMTLCIKALVAGTVLTHIRIMGCIIVYYNFYKN